MTGTAFPICVYFGNSLSKIDSLGFPALLIPPVVLLPANKYQSGNVCNLAHSLTVNDLGWEKWTKSSAKEQAVIFGPFSSHFFGNFSGTFIFLKLAYTEASWRMFFAI